MFTVQKIALSSFEDCPDPGSISNGRILGSSFAKGHSLRYVCNPGFQLLGEKSISCLDDASWSDLPPKCITEGEVTYRDVETGGNCPLSLSLTLVTRPLHFDSRFDAPDLI